MAHKVKCAICGAFFDRDKEPYTQIGNRRYAHEACAEAQSSLKTQEQKDEEALEEYIKQLFNIDHITPKIAQQINNFSRDYGFTYSGMLGTLIYAFEIRHNDIDKANGGIGIVPYIYDEARIYYQTLSEIQLKNESTNFIPKDIVIYITSPKRKIKKKKFFSFLDEEELSEQ